MNNNATSSAIFNQMQQWVINSGKSKNFGFLTKVSSTVVILFALTISVIGFSAFTSRTAIQKEVMAYLQLPLDEQVISAYFVNPAQRTSLSVALAEVYSTNNYEPIWLDGGKSSTKLDSLLLALKVADKEGLKPATYHVTQMEQLKADAGLFSDAARVAELDQLATAAYLLYASHLYNGSITPSQLDSTWHIAPKFLPLAGYLKQALQDGTIRKSLTNLSDANPTYTLLKKELANLKEVAEMGGWPIISTVLGKNDSGEAVQTLKTRLILSGDLDSTFSKNNLYDQALTQAVQKFQQRHGLPVTGKADQPTLAALNIPVQKRIQQVIINLERMRWLPRTAGKTIITVNIPDYKLRVWEQNKQVFEANVVVGKIGHTTPIFEDSLESIVFSPEWNVPNQIATDEILPRLQENANYLKKNNFEVYNSYKANAKPINPYSVNWHSVSTENFKYRFVQKANEKNALGAVKFLFPNALNIYIHDTPAKGLFKETKRAYSHGCIRLQNPGKLAVTLLKNDPNWTEAKIQEKMGLTESTRVTLAKAVKVEIIYLTAFVQDGELQFRDDVYGYDQPQLQTLRNQAIF